MIVLFTDFGIQDPYVGQMKAVLAQHAPGHAIIDLLHQVPDYNIRAAAYLLPAYVGAFPLGSVFLCVLDPGVGGSRLPCVAHIDGRWFVGPDNGLFSILQQRSLESSWWQIPMPEQAVSMTFHGRDVFAPTAARLAQGNTDGLQAIAVPALLAGLPNDLAEIIYIDHYGNLVSGYRFNKIPVQPNIMLHNKLLGRGNTFADVEIGEAFYYGNSNGLLEIAVNQGSAREVLGACVGDKLSIAKAE